MNSKAQGLSLTTIVTAVVVLIVLVVLIMLFTGYFSNFTPKFLASGEQTCTAPPRDASEGCNEKERQVFGNFGDDFKDKICCKLVDAEETCRSDCINKYQDPSDVSFLQQCLDECSN